MFTYETTSGLLAKKLVKKHYLVVNRIAPVFVVVFSGPFGVLMRYFFLYEPLVHGAVDVQEKIAEATVDDQGNMAFFE